MPPAVFHVRLKNFELQAECLLNPALRTRPVAIISSHRPGGSVVALSPEAGEEGLYRGLKVSQARRMSHSALLLPYNRSLYGRLNRYLYRTVAAFAPLVEPVSLGQFYLDMGGMERIYPSRCQAGVAISRSIASKVALSGVVGISVNKLVSGIATAVVPERVHEVQAGEEARFLAPLEAPVLPTVRLPPVRRLVRFLFLELVEHIQQVVDRPGEARVLFGSHYPRLAREARGEDTAAVRPPAFRDHLMEQAVLPAESNDTATLRAVVSGLARQVAFTLRERRQVARRVNLEVHYSDGFRQARRGTFSSPDDTAVVGASLELFERAHSRRNRIRTILIDATDLISFASQLEIFSGGTEKDRALDRTLDRIRRRYGPGSIQTAAAWGLLAAAEPSCSFT